MTRRHPAPFAAQCPTSPCAPLCGLTTPDVVPSDRDVSGVVADSPYGPIVHLDLRHLGEKLIDTKLPFVRELCLKYERIDPVHELIPVRPVVHYMMGGVSTDIDGATPLVGLYAAGRPPA
jgi:succinate dehydrogenase/fumarate reductase flavoprotein subunit